MNCKKGTEIILQQIAEVLENINEQDYSKPLELFNGTSIGQHFRHILDFYTCLSSGIANGRVDYCHRERNPYIEQDKREALASVKRFNNEIFHWNEDAQIEVLADFSSEIEEDLVVVNSSIGRELMYAYDHAIHHLAMIKMGLKVAFPNTIVNKELGVAPSTIKHWKIKKASLG